MSSQPSDSEISQAYSKLDKRIQHWIWEQRWDELRDIQEFAINTILTSESDVVISASTASGKTEAAFLPILTKVVENKKTGIDVLYISPLKALINNQFDRLDLLCERLDVPVTKWHGDVSQTPKMKLVQNPNGILIITPESLEALFITKSQYLPGMFSNLSYAVIDELHSFIGSERGCQLQSLLHRLEAIIGREIPKIALSATLSDFDEVAKYLRPNDVDNVTVIQSKSTGSDIKAQIRGYLIKEHNEKGEKLSNDLTEHEIPNHLYRTMRGTSNLIFANSRSNVENFSDILAKISEKEHIKNEFFPHHGSLSKDIREDIEERLRNKSLPTTVICTSTLEMGIDIGNMKSVAQIGSPPSVSSLRQRLGRSGRRGEPAVLRMYACEHELTANSHIDALLRLSLIEQIAILNLAIKGWYEPAENKALHLSTFIQQSLSVIAQYGGVSVSKLYRLLCLDGAFHNIDKPLFLEFIKNLHGNSLITQMKDGSLLLDVKGEKLVNHYSFYTAFIVSNDFRLYAEGKLLGTIPVNNPLVPDSNLIFAGRRWTVKNVNDEQKVIDLIPSKGGDPPIFLGDGIGYHEVVHKEMLSIFNSDDIPQFLNSMACDLLIEGRNNFNRYLLSIHSIHQLGENCFLFLWAGSKVANTIMLQLNLYQLKVEKADVFIEVKKCKAEDLLMKLELIKREGFADPITLASVVLNKIKEKHDQYLNDDLLNREYASRYIDVERAEQVLNNMSLTYNKTPDCEQ